MAVSPVPNIELEEKLKTYREFIDKGSEIRINTRTGVIEKAGAINQIFRVTAFQKLRIVHPDMFKVDRQTWEDRTGSVAGEEYDWSDVILIASNPSWKPGSEKGDLETIMLNRKTGISRRVPFAYGAIIDACFSPDHRYCYVTGWIPYEGTIGVFAVDLETHEHFRLGSEPLLTGMNLVAEVSPDDSFLAVVQIEYEAGPLQFRLHLVDTESGDSIKIGDTHDMGSVNWLPESNGFILAIRENDGLLETKATRICHMDLDGKLTELCQGSEPRLLGKSRRILLKGEDGSWYTCNMQGKDRQIVGDGLKGFGSPSANNPADNVLMTKFDDKDGPRPYLGLVFGLSLDGNSMIDRVAPTIRPTLPVRGYQRWRSLLFMHWAVPIELIRRWVPKRLEIDLYDGLAYVGLVPFAMEGVRNAWWPPFTGLT
ncbi:yqjF, partial [Symbiodinium microadriaticum]